MLPFTSDNLASAWLQWWSTVSWRGTLILLTILAVVQATQRWTNPAWRFVASLVATGAFALVAVTAMFQWRWEVLPTSWPFQVEVFHDSIATSSASRWIFAAWAVGTCCFLARLVLGHLSLCRLAATCPMLNPGSENPGSENPGSDSGELIARVERLRDQIGLRRAIRVFISDRREIPMTWGVIRTNLLLPQSILSWPASQLDAVLLHEMAHIRRADCFWQWWIQGVCCLFWYNPAIWLASRKMWHERETACDAIAISAGAVPSAYAQALLAVSQRKLKSGTPLAVAMSGGSLLYRRLEKILKSTPPPAASVSFGWWVGWVTLILIAALIQPRLSLDESPSADAQSPIAQTLQTPAPPVNTPPPLSKNDNAADATALAAGQVRYDPRLKTFVADSEYSGISNPLLSRDPLSRDPLSADITRDSTDQIKKETTSKKSSIDDGLVTGEHGPIVSIRLDDPVGEEVWNAIGRIDTLRRLRLNRLPEDSLMGAKLPSSVRELDLSQTSISDWDPFCLPLLTRLSIRDARLSSSAFLGISSMASLELLQVEKSQVRTCGVGDIASLQNLRSLSLAGSDVDDASLAMFAQLPNLRQLSLANMKITQTGLREIARSASIEELDLTGTDFDGHALMALGTMPNLRTIQLSCLDGRLLRILSAAPNLREIFVKNSAGKIECFSPQQWLKRLSDQERPRCCELEQATVT